MRGALEYGGPPAGLCRVSVSGQVWKVGYEEPITDREGPRAFPGDSPPGAPFGAYFQLLFRTCFWEAIWEAFGPILAPFWKPLGDHFASQNRSKK